MAQKTSLALTVSKHHTKSAKLQQSCHEIEPNLSMFLSSKLWSVFLWTLGDNFLYTIMTFAYKKDKKAQLTQTNPRDAEACKNYSNSTCFVSFHRIPFR